VAAVAKSIGGLDYSFNLRGSKDKVPEIVPAASSEIRFAQFSPLSRRKFWLCPSLC